MNKLKKMYNISRKPLDKEETSQKNINNNKILLTENDSHEIINNFN